MFTLVSKVAYCVGIKQSKVLYGLSGFIDGGLSFNKNSHPLMDVDTDPALLRYRKKILIHKKAIKGYIKEQYKKILGLGFVEYSTKDYNVLSNSIFESYLSSLPDEKSIEKTKEKIIKEQQEKKEQEKEQEEKEQKQKKEEKKEKKEQEKKK